MGVEKKKKERKKGAHQWPNEDCKRPWKVKAGQ